jgi:taurine dioxygenase
MRGSPLAAPRNISIFSPSSTRNTAELDRETNPRRTPGKTDRPSKLAPFAPSGPQIASLPNCNSILEYYALMADRSLQIRPIAGALGAEITGVDLSGDLEDGTIAAIRRAWLDHLVIFFRGQDLPSERFLAFARHFGDVVEYPFIKGIEGSPLITPVVKLEHERVNFGGLWHSDTAYLERPPMGTMLIAREVPPYGGDTLFANMYLAYESLSLGMWRLLDGLVAVNSSAKADVSKTREDRMRDGARSDAKREYVGEHPVVRTHPETGRKALYVNSGHTVRFKDMSEAESAPLLNYLFAHQQRPEFTCRFRWEVGSLALWDNRCAQHNPINDYHGWRRVMHRVTLAGDQPR